MAIWNTTVLVPNTLKRSEFPPFCLLPPPISWIQVSKMVSDPQTTHICRFCLDETRGEMKTRGAVQVHLIRDRFTIQLPCNSVGFQKQKNVSLGHVKWPAQFCCKFVSSSIEFIVCTVLLREGMLACVLDVHSMVCVRGWRLSTVLYWDAVLVLMSCDRIMV